MKHVKITIRGDVQGVGFRHAAKAKAEELHLNGYAANTPDGFVYIEADGEEEDIYEFLEWCHTGPEGARVFKVDSNIADDYAGYNGFSIRDGVVD